MHLGRPLPVWRDRRFSLTTCPVLVFTPELRELLDTFYRTHDVEPGFARARWVRREWPGPGRWDEQDHLLIQRLETVRATYDALMNEEDDVKRQRRERRDKTKAKKQTHARR